MPHPIKRGARPRLDRRRDDFAGTDFVTRELLVLIFRCRSNRLLLTSSSVVRPRLCLASTYLMRRKSGNRGRGVIVLLVCRAK